MSPNDTDGMANSVDPDLGAVWSGSALFAKTYLSENLGSLRYYMAKLCTHPFWFDGNSAFQNHPMCICTNFTMSDNEGVIF